MFNTLVESKAKRTRSTRSTMASVLLHGVIIASAVSLTMATKGDARPPMEMHDIIYNLPVVPEPPKMEHVMAPSQRQSPTTPFRTVIIPTDMPKGLPPIELNTPEVPADVFRIGGAGPVLPYAPEPKGTYVAGGVVNSDAVERIPSLLGNARAPRYPDALRQSHVDGKVSVRFVVDTLGRAEMGGLEIVDTSHPLFAEAVKNALAFYRFSPGEVGGHKVRTMVQIPFTFSLTK
ncbi:MAG: TonB family protein [Gemmatimonadetes bacterium]|nr:TonB family protein [Gemmatimonadota bacterium]